MILAPGHETSLETEPAELINVMHRPKARAVCTCGWKADAYVHRSVVPNQINVHGAAIGSGLVAR